MLAPLRLRSAPFLPVLALLCAAAFLFPVDMKALLSRPRAGEREIASIGEDLRGLGERLEEAARTENLGRRLAIAQDLAQLGRDLAANRITSDDALDRIDQLQSRVGQEYQMQLLADPSEAAGLPQGRSGSAPGNAQGSQGAQDSQGSGDGQAPDQSGSSASGDSKALSDALNRLRSARDALQGQGSGTTASRPSGSAQKAGDAGGQGTGATPGSQGAGGNQSGATEGAKGGAGRDPGAGSGSGNADQAPGSAPGTEPALTKTGTPTEITRGEQATPRRVQGNPGEGDSTSFLVRALPEWTGAKLPEETVRRQYALAAESALSRDEIPPKLKASVRDYFTDIGMSGGQ
jgi:hypothetical protein